MPVLFKVFRTPFVPLVLAAILAPIPPALADRGGRPNIILILADDIGYEGFGCYGGESYKTPHIDKLSSNGVRFTNCFSQPLCTPSRVKLLTGKSNIRNYSRFSILKPQEKTIAHMMQRAGYKTAAVGKWQLLGARHYGQAAGTGTHPRDAGFDEYCLWQIDRLGSRYWDPQIDQNGRILADTKGRYGPDVFCDFILRFLERQKDEPLFIFYPMVLPHNPFLPTPGSADRKKSAGPANFADMVAHIDRIVGRIVAKVDELGLRENTLILFTSDNGTNRRITSRAGGRRIKGGKGLTTDAGTRVPLVASWPGVVPAGRVCDDLIDFSDFLPTLAEATGAVPPQTVLDGRSIWPQLRGERGLPRRWIFCYYNPRPGEKKWKERCFARDKRWKLYRSDELYDVVNDVLEKRPLQAAGNTAEAGEARRRLQAALDSMPLRPAAIKIK